MVQDTSALMLSKLENVIDETKKLVENKILQAQLDIVTEKSNLLDGTYISFHFIFMQKLEYENYSHDN